MKTTFAVFMALAVLVSSGKTASAQKSPKNFVLDESKPYVYIEFDHAGAREPVEQGEPRQGLWLRILNNSVVPIEVETMDTATHEKLMLVPDVITPIVGIIPRSGVNRKVMPAGYASGLGVARQIAPGKSLVFSIPANHVSQDWYMLVPFHFSLAPVKEGVQPICYAAFTWNDLPNSYRNSHKN